MCPQYLWNTDFFEWAKSQNDHTYDAIITDPPYTSFRKDIGEKAISDKSFDLTKFCEECVRLLKPDGIFISFCSIHLMKDYFNYFEGKLRFRCEQIWDKRPIRTWISYGLPLRHVEYIVYFGEGKLDFRDGSIKKKYNRTQFGGELRNTTSNTKKFAEGQFEQIIHFMVPKKEGRSQTDNEKREKKLGKYNKLNIKDSDKKKLENQIEQLKIDEIIDVHPTRKPPEFSDYFRRILSKNLKILDPCCGTGSLICSFGDNALGIDVKRWKTTEPKNILDQKNFLIDDFT